MKRLKSLLMALMLFPISHAALASAPLSKVNNPGFYRFELGSYQVIALSDGVSKLPAETLLLNDSADNIAQSLKKNHADNPVTTSINAYLINTGKKLMLFDAGSGGLMGANLGNVVSDIKLAGYSPEQIDDIYITHLHPDHIGGLVKNNIPAFPEATVWVEKKRLTIGWT